MVMFTVVSKKETVIDLILEARRRYRVTNAQVGKSVGVGDQAISNYLAGDVPRPQWLKNWEQLLPVLRIEIDRLRAAVENSLDERHTNATPIDGSLPSGLSHQTLR